MCLILFAIEPEKPAIHAEVDEQYRLIVAANRDEYYERPAREAMFWPENPDILGGQDLSMGGTWLGITRSGRFAAVTNYRETPLHPAPPRSRGDLVAGFLNTDIPARRYLEEIRSRGEEYRGFNLLLGDIRGFYYLSNRQSNIVKLPPGFYGLSNQFLDCNWPKVITGRGKLRSLVLGETGPASDSHEQNTNNVDLTTLLFNLLSDTGDERAFSNSFIESAEYGTCAETVVVWGQDGSLSFEERSFKKNGEAGTTQRYDFTIGAFSHPKRAPAVREQTKAPG